LVLTDGLVIRAAAVKGLIGGERDDGLMSSIDEGVGWVVVRVFKVLD
jgi:hypothetical protein